MAHEELILKTLNDLRGDVSRTEQKVDSLNQRLFENGNGAIPALWRAYKGTKDDIEHAQDCADGATTKAVAIEQKMSTQKAYIMGYASGASLVLTIMWFVAKAALVKLGWIH